VKRVFALLLLALLLTTACSPQQQAAPPGQPVTANPPKETQTPELPKPDPNLPKADQLRAEPNLKVTTTKATKVYTGPGTFYLLVDELQAGTPVAYLNSSSQGWLRIRTPDGATAWVSAADAAIADGSGQPVTYKLQSSRWTVQTASGLTLQMNRVATGVLQLTVSGLPGKAQIAQLELGKIALLIPLDGSFRGALDINDGGVTRLSVSPKGILVETDGGTLYRTLSEASGKVELEFRPGLEAITATANGWSIAVRGDLRPVLRTEGNDLIVDLPGALRASNKATALPGMTILDVEPERQGSGEPNLGSATAAIPTRMTAGGLRMRQPAPASPYMLLRADSSHVELRIRPRGLSGKVIVLDPGHGGEETGAVGNAGNIEKNVNLAVALRLRPLLEAAGAKVIMTRTTDTRVLAPDKFASATSAVERTQMDLAERSAMSNRAQADMFISIHANGGPMGDGGTEVYWAVSNLNAAHSLRLAGLAQQELVAALGLYNRGAKQRPFNVIRMSEAPAILVEMGFMTNPREEQLLISAAGQDAVAQALLKTVTRYFEP